MRDRAAIEADAESVYMGGGRLSTGSTEDRRFALLMELLLDIRDYQERIARAVEGKPLYNAAGRCVFCGWTKDVHDDDGGVCGTPTPGV